MKLTSGFASLVALALAVPGFAAPSAEPAPAEFTHEARATNVTLEARADFWITVCTLSNGNGQCVTRNPPEFNTCRTFGNLGLPGYQTWRVGTGTTCLWYTTPDCKGPPTGTQSDAVNAPGYEVVPAFWIFNTQSWKCWV